MTTLRFGIARVHFHVSETSPMVSRILAFATKMGLKGASISIHDVQLGVVDENGYALSGRLEMRLLYLAQGLFHATDGDVWLPKVLRPEADSWRRMLQSAYVAYNRDAMIFPIFMENAYRVAAVSIASGDRVLCYVSFPLLGAYTAERLPLQLPVPCSLRQILSFRNLFQNIRILPGQLCDWLSAISFFRKSPDDSVDPEARRLGTVLQQNTGGIFTRYPASGHLYWHDGSGIDPARVVLYCDRSDSRCDSTFRETASRFGFGWVNAASIPGRLERPWLTFFQVLRRTLPSFPRRLWHRHAVWRWIALIRYGVLLESYRALIRRYNVRAAYQSWVFLPETLALAMALRAEGEIFLWNFWSIHALPVAQHHFGIADLVFCWGPYHKGFYTAHQLDYRLLLQVGVIMGDGRHESDTAAAAALRAQFPPSVRFVLTVLDTSYGREAHNTAEHIIQFYIAVLTLVTRHTDWGCIIKTKSMLAQLPQMSGFQDVMTGLEREQRCIVLPSRERVSVVAQAGDLSVCASVNTAGFLAGIAGSPAVHLDLGGLVTHPISLAGGDGKIVFRTVEDFIQAIETFAAGDCSIGDHEPWCDLIDPFRDGTGRLRAGKAIRNYLAARDRGLDRDAALSEVARWHAAQWGQESVQNGKKAIENEADQLWRQSRSLVIENLPEPRTQRSV